MSNRHSYNLSRNRYNMDDIALFDYPPALATIREHIGPIRRIHVICHCLGSMSFMMSLFGKAVDGIRSVIANSVALTPRIPRWSSLKLSAGPSFVMRSALSTLIPIGVVNRDFYGKTDRMVRVGWASGM